VTPRDDEAADGLARDVHHDSSVVDDTFSWDEARWWIELGCWTAVALVPFLYWVNGPAVSQDQLVVRWLVVIIAMGGAVGLRLRARSRAS
jgi:hypothetical protein